MSKINDVHQFNLMHLLLSIKNECVKIDDKLWRISLLMMNEIKNEKKKKLETFSFRALFVTIH